MQEPEVLAAIISGASTILAAVIAAIAAAFIGKKFAAREKLQAERDSAIRDIHFLLKVEQFHCALHKQNTGESNQRRIRELVRTETGLEWSGRFTPGRSSGS